MKLNMSENMSFLTHSIVEQQIPDESTHMHKLPWAFVARMHKVTVQF